MAPQSGDRPRGACCHKQLLSDSATRRNRSSGISVGVTEFAPSQRLCVLFPSEEEHFGGQRSIISGSSNATGGCRAGSTSRLVIRRASKAIPATTRSQVHGGKLKPKDKDRTSRKHQL